MVKQRQEIVVETTMHTEKQERTAMTTASKKNGVMSVTIVRERNHLIVIGVGVDSVDLTRSLRQKFGFAHIVSVTNICNSQTIVRVRDEQEHVCFRRYDDDDCYPTQQLYHHHHRHQPSYDYIAVPVQDLDPPNFCSIM